MREQVKKEIRKLKSLIKKEHGFDITSKNREAESVALRGAFANFCLKMYPEIEPKQLAPIIGVDRTTVIHYTSYEENPPTLGDFEMYYDFWMVKVTRLHSMYIALKNQKEDTELPDIPNVPKKIGDMTAVEFNNLKKKARLAEPSRFAVFMTDCLGYSFKRENGAPMDKWEAFEACPFADIIIDGKVPGIYAEKR